jgi:hypothetical protein
LATLVTWSVLGRGLPELRHDWHFPADAQAMSTVIAEYADGWTQEGLGAPQPYPTFFPIAVLLWPLARLGVAPLALVGLMLAASIVLAAGAAMRIAQKGGASPLGAVALALLAALNPWVFTEEVAGHPYMVLGYAVVLALIAEIGRPLPRGWALATLAALSITQIEFFLITAIPLSAWFVVRRRWAPLLTMIAFAAPLAVGITAEYGTIRETPYSLYWQERSSIALGQGLLLTGYGPGYAHAFAHVWIASLILALFALPGAFVALRAPLERLVILVGVIALFFASGTAGPTAALYRTLVLRVTESGVYRELYDMIAFVAVALVVALARSLTSRWAAWIGVIAAAALAIPWIVSPAADAFISAPDLPRATIPMQPNQRIALLPAFQPLSFEGKGSGTDPDAYVRDGSATPLNEWFPSFPVDVALAYAERDGDDRAAAALGVMQVITRPYLHENAADPFAWIGSHLRLRHVRRHTEPTTPMPLLSLRSAPPTEVSVGDHPDENAVFFGDLHPQAIHVITPSRETIDPSQAWIDARLAVRFQPEDGNAFGGVLTTSAVPLPIPPARAVLARTDGELDDDLGRRIATATDFLRWWPLAPDARAVICRGTCVVVLTGEPPPRLASHSPDDPHQRTALAIRQLTPWLAVATLSPAGGTLRYNVRYDAQWAAWAGGWLPHVRLDAAVNGWIVRPSPASREVVLVEIVAVAQALLEIVAFAVWLAVVVLAATRSRRPARS